MPPRMRVTTCKIGDIHSRYPNLGVSSYQRAVVWSPRQKAAFIRSLLLDYPTGAVVLNYVSHNGKPGSPRPLAHLSSSHDIIDGQQRLTTLYEFLDDPTLYVTTWAKNPPRAPNAEEPELIQYVRAKFDELRRLLRPARANYVTRGTSSRDLKAKIAQDAASQLRRQLADGTDPDPRFYALVQSLNRLRNRIAQRKIIIEELTDIETTEAETIYHLINTSGTQLLWWELLWGKPAFVHESYASTKPYRTSRDREVRTLSIFYRANARLRVHAGGTNDSFWHAMLALGEYVQSYLSVQDPLIQRRLLSRDERRLPVDGLGFRLTSTALSHDIGRAAIYSLFDQYSKDTVRATIDTLYDTCDLLMKTPDASTPDFLFFKKYAQFGADPIQAYPLVGIFVSAAKLVAKNKVEGAGITLTPSDCRSLRELTEEIFREVVTTTKWAGTGDSRLKEWLDRHFEPAPAGGNHPVESLGAVRTISSTYNERQWTNLLKDLEPTGQRNVDRRTAALHFWIQYLFDSKQPGSLPKGTVQFDHIVPFERSPHNLTTHPLNIAAIRDELNRRKGGRSYRRWAPTGMVDREYRMNVLCQPAIRGIPGAAAVDFLESADHAGLTRMISGRRKVFEFGLGALLREWITSGDHEEPVALPPLGVSH